MSTKICDVFVRCDEESWIQFQPAKSFHFRTMSPEGDFSIEITDRPKPRLRMATVYPDGSAYRIIELYNGPLIHLLGPLAVPHLFRQITERLVGR